LCELKHLQLFVLTDVLLFGLAMRVAPVRFEEPCAAQSPSWRVMRARLS
jgi:hypothetical protein